MAKATYYNEQGKPISEWEYNNYYNQGYAGLDYDTEQWNARMDAKSAAEDALRLKTQYSGGSIGQGNGRGNLLVVS